MGTLQIAPASSRPVAVRYDLVPTLALFALLSIVLIGFDPLGDKAKALAKTGDGNVVRQLSYSLVFLVVLVYSGALNLPKRFLVLSKGLTITLLWCAISMAWAVEPGIATRRLILTTIIMWTLFKSVEEAGYERSLLTLRLVLVITLVANYAAIVITPNGVHHAVLAGDPGLVGDWRGILMQKNFAGAVCAVTILAFIFDARRIRPSYRWGVLLASAYFLYRTHSKTSEALIVLSLAMGWIFTRYNPRYRTFLVPGLIFIMIAGLLIVEGFGDKLMEPFDGPDALTGRVQIWPPLMAFWNDHWLLGAGYGSFWNIGADSPIYRYATGWVAKVGNGHNGYIDLLTQIGLPGLVLAVLAAVILPIYKLLTSINIKRSQGSLLIAILIFCTGHNFSESSLLDRDMIVQVFQMLTIALIYCCHDQVAPVLLRRGRTDRRPQAELVDTRAEQSESEAKPARDKEAKTASVPFHSQKAR